MRGPIAAALAVTALALAGATPAAATTMSLDLDPDGSGPHEVVGDHTYFFPRWSNATLHGTTLDDAGAAGNTCIKTLLKPVQAPAFEQDGGLWCPNDFGDGTGSWWWNGVTPVENTQFTAVTEPDDWNGPAQTGVVTILTGPDLHWHITYNGNRRVLDLQAKSDAEDYAGTITVTQRGRTIATARVAGNDTNERYVRVAPKRRHRPARCSGCLALGARFTATLTPDDPGRWVTMRASGSVVHDHLGDAEPVL